MPILRAVSPNLLLNKVTNLVYSIVAVQSYTLPIMTIYYMDVHEKIIIKFLIL